MKMLKKMLMILVVSLLIFAVCQPGVFAFDWAGQIEDVANADGDTNVTDSFTKISGAIITIARVVCMGVAITMLVMVGIKYMSAAPGEKADIKKHAVM